MLYFHRTSSSPSTADTRLPPLLPAGGLVSCFNEKIGCIVRELLWAPASPLPPTCILACLSGIINCSLFTGSLAHTRCYTIISPILKNKQTNTFLWSPCTPTITSFPLLCFPLQHNSSKELPVATHWHFSFSTVDWKHSQLPCFPMSLWKLLLKVTTDLHVAAILCPSLICTVNRTWGMYGSLLPDTPSAVVYTFSWFPPLPHWSLIYLLVCSQLLPL